MLEVLKSRFEKNMALHPDLRWETVERRLLENLRSMTDKTVLIVTHRPAALDICDRVLEITEKGVVEK